MLSPELFREMDARGEIERKLSRAPFKDTIPLPNGGYVIIRFVADNPGEHSRIVACDCLPYFFSFDCFSVSLLQKKKKHTHKQNRSGLTVHQLAVSRTLVRLCVQLFIFSGFCPFVLVAFFFIALEMLWLVLNDLCAE